MYSISLFYASAVKALKSTSNVFVNIVAFDATSNRCKSVESILISYEIAVDEYYDNFRHSLMEIKSKKSWK